MDAQRMNAAVHQVSRGVEDHPVPGDGAFPGKSGGDDVEMIVATATTGTGVAGMPVRIVTDAQRFGLQDGQPFLKQGDGVSAHAGSTFLNGLIVTFSYTPAAT